MPFEAVRTVLTRTHAHTYTHTHTSRLPGTSSAAEAAQAVGGRGSEPGSGSADRHRRSVFEGRLFDIRKLNESWTNQLEHSGDVGQGQDSAGEATGTGDLASSVWAKYVEWYSSNQ